MRCSEIVHTLAGCHLVLDGVFENLGLVGDEDAALLVFAQSEKYIQLAQKHTNVSAMIVSPTLVPHLPENIGIIAAEDPAISFFLVHEYLFKTTDFYGKKSPSRIADSAIIHPSAYVSDSGVVIGEHAVIEPRACILDNVTIGSNVIIRAGSIVGTEGFEYKRTPTGIISIPHAGGVDIQSGVEILSNCCVARSLFRRRTVIGKDTKINNLVHIAHNASIGERCLIAAGACVAGSARVGSDVWIGPNAVISNGVSIGNRARVTIGSVVVKDVEDDSTVTGNFALSHRAFLSHWIDSSKRSRHS